MNSVNMTSFEGSTILRFIPAGSGTSFSHSQRQYCNGRSLPQCFESFLNVSSLLLCLFVPEIHHPVACCVLPCHVQPCRLQNCLYAFLPSPVAWTPIGLGTPVCLVYLNWITERRPICPQVSVYSFLQVLQKNIIKFILSLLLFFRDRVQEWFITNAELCTFL